MTAQDKMQKHYPVNERAKYNYRIHLARVGRKDSKTIIAILKHIREYEIFTNFDDFRKFDKNIAHHYIQNALDRELPLSHITDNLRSLRDFLSWLERQTGYRNKIKYNDIDYLNVSNNQRKQAKASGYKHSYKFDQIIQTIRNMPDKRDCEKRNKAIISLQALCTLRISELRTVKIKNIIKEDGHYFVHINPKDMAVKFAKTRHAVFIALPDDIIQNVIAWRDYLIQSNGFHDSDPLFPVIPSKFNQQNMLEQHIRRMPITSDTTIRSIFKRAFEAANMPYINPHSFRNTLARYAQKQSPQFLNAVRQNLGHSSIDTTLSSYGQLSTYDQQRIIAEQSIK